jgi:hypothetical protein
MSDEPVKKGFFARINEALYETVETGEQAPPLERESAGGEEAAAPGAAASAQALGDPPELAARVRADIEGRGKALTQFLALAGSFTDIIPEESGRYRAAMKALEKTGNLTRSAVLGAADDQLRALGAQREVFAGAVARKREAVQTRSAEVASVRAQIAELQQSIERLQQQEQEIVRGAAAEEGTIAAAEQGFTALLATMEGEITATRQKIEKYLPG